MLGNDFDSKLEAELLTSDELRIIATNEHELKKPTEKKGFNPPEQQYVSGRQNLFKGHCL